MPTNIETIWDASEGEIRVSDIDETLFRRFREVGWDQTNPGSSNLDIFMKYTYLIPLHVTEGLMPIQTTYTHARSNWRLSSMKSPSPLDTVAVKGAICGSKITL
jgi:hypothetical protein